MVMLLATQSEIRTVGIVCGVVAILALLFCAWGVYSTIHEIRHCTLTVFARCTKEEKRWNHTGSGNGVHVSRSSYHVAFLEYEVNGQPYKTVIDEGPLDDAGNCVGTDFELLVNPEQPYEVRRPGEQYSIVGAVLTAIFALSFGAVSIWLLFFY